MKAGRGKGKGSAFERQVCNDLSRLVQPKTHETLFWRSAMSGGRATVRAKVKKRDSSQAGDISCVHPAGAWLVENFVIECKFYKDLSLMSSLLERKGLLAKFWREVRKLAKKHGKEPLLIARQNRTRTLVLTTSNGHHVLSVWRADTPTYLIHSKVLKCLVLDYKEFMRT